MAALDIDAVKRRALSAYQAFTPAQLVLAGLLAAVTVFGGIALMSWVSAPSYAVLYSGLAAKDTAAVTAKLSADGVAYKLTASGTAVEVPQGALDKERVALAAAGLPKGGTSGWEVLDKEGLTTSSFRQQVDYQRALEGEIARTLGSIDGVDNAQVHLVLPEESLFTDSQRNARASVLLTTSGQLSDSQVNAVVSTVASAVPNLDQSAVTVTDSSGRLLTGAGASSGSGSGGSSQQAQQAAYEDAATARVQSMLDQLVGPGHSVVRVSATLNFDSTKSTVKTVDPTKSAITASDGSKETYTTPATAVANGALTVTNSTGLTNNGTPSGTTGSPSPSTYTKTTSTTTTSTSERLDDITKAIGSVQRLSVAVVLDGRVASLPPTTQVSQLVSAAAGVDPSRGDQVVVNTANFDTTAAAKPAAAAGPMLSSGMQKTLSTGVAIVILLVTLLLLARSARRPKSSEIPLADGLPALPGGTRAALTGAPLGSARAALPSGMPALPAPRHAADEAVDLLDAVERQPDDITHLLHGWLSETDAPNASTR